MPITGQFAQELNTPSARVLKEQMVASGLTLLTNRNGLLPLKRLDTLRIASLTVGEGTRFAQTLSDYSSVASFSIGRDASLEELDSLTSKLASYNLVIVGYLDTDARAFRNFGVTVALSRYLADLARSKRVVLCYFGIPYGVGQFTSIDSYAAVACGYEFYEPNQKVMAEVLFGARKASGLLPVTVSAAFPLGHGIPLGEVTRIRFGDPREVGVNPSALSAVDSLARKAIAEKATPGCQILAMKNGVIFYNKSFGSQTYYPSDTVSLSTIYDMASVTKVAATLPILMELADVKTLDVDAPLGRYLPFLKGSNKYDLTIKEMLTHQAGLLPGVPMYQRYLRTINPTEELYSKTQSDQYPFKISDTKFQNRFYMLDTAMFSSLQTPRFGLKVAEGLFVNESIKDTILRLITDSKLSGRGEYKYSDLGFYYYKKIIEGRFNRSLDEVANSQFYRPLGMSRTGFNPYRWSCLNEIAPTETDYTFRNQQIRGTVHDPGASLVGGVGGHAGLFSTSLDMAKLFQMYLNKGSYGGEKYFSSTTFDTFNTVPYHGNRRALGFDKVEPDSAKGNPVCPEASLSSFGHTGFTGTMVWVDPEHQLVYVFLSNRVYPAAEPNKLSQINTRTDILSAFYNAIIGKNERGVLIDNSLKK